jgi:hypothetical protein
MTAIDTDAREASTRRLTKGRVALVKVGIAVDITETQVD